MWREREAERQRNERLKAKRLADEKRAFQEAQRRKKAERTCVAPRPQNARTHGGCPHFEAVVEPTFDVVR